MPPLVTVKQPDGSYAKITLEEFLLRQKNAAQSAAALSAAAATDSVVQSVVPPPLPTPPEVPALVVQNTEMPESHRVEVVSDLGQEKNDHRTVVSETGSVVKTGLHSPTTPVVASEKVVLPEPQAPAMPSTEVLVPADQEVAVSTPFNMFKHETTPPPVTMVSKPVIPLEPLPVQRISVPDQIAPQIRDTKRPSVTDVVYRPVAIGPIEEIQGMSLTDFRRLSPVPTDAALRLEQKFTNLKGESIVLFLQGVDAWRQSALYQEYTDRLLYAVLHRSSLDSVLRKTKTITLDEITALVAMEKRLTV